MFKISNFTRPPGKNRILIKQHREIYETIKRGNPDLAAQKMEDHLRFVEIEWREDVRRQLDKKSLEVLQKSSEGTVLIRH